MPRTASPRRRRLLRYGAALAVLAALGGYLAVQYDSSGSKNPPRCVVEAKDGDGDGTQRYEMSLAQAVNAATISAVGTTRGMPERAVTIALATALQESTLRNIDYGDRDSVGLFQQRPSQGWGTVEQIMDPVYSSEKFYEGLAEVPGYSRLPLTVAAQRVQRSGFPQAYAKHEPDAALLAAALTGRRPASLNCTPSTATADGPGDAARVRTELVRAFGKDVLPGAVAAGASAASTVSVPVPAASARSEDKGAPQRGWELAHWAVAQSEALRIERVSYADRVWDAGSGWRTERAKGKESGTTAVRIRVVQ
ncbi:hypothetical protein N7925_11145 [Streptomyces sp. CA-278952]|uniref:hypothetical protein n=1 Tax=unclassified Streptomyces TaxID=2593676 RepID=UPI0022422423|nr:MULTISPECIES: hypothetical protein [unclassified Streptomyces]UZI28915.1 hypothetical protein OH133_12645 [Streptomyces sp. VB1]WDG28866.1 hypothetical protein N7925_11145 [Streptomyces sp. CA-278952]